MQFLVEFFPIVIFFYVFKYKGIIIATVATMLVSLLQLIIIKISTGKYQKMQLASFISLLVLGGVAIIFKKDVFIKWKPTAIYWILAVIFFVMHFFRGKILIEKLINNIYLPKKIWNILNILWILFFVFMGGLNLYIVYYFDTNTWVNFKLFGTLVLNLLFVLLQAVFIYKYSTNKIS